MRLSARDVANGAAWAVIFALILAACVVAAVLGFFGLILLGGATWLICVRAELNEDAPTAGTEVFRARLSGAASPEQRAAGRAERQGFAAGLRFYRRCGMALAAIGAVGFALQRWGM